MKIKHSFFRILFVCGVLTFIFLLSGEQVSAQGLIETMTEQLAKLELCLQEAKQGYSIVQKGLTTIGQIKQGDFDLHSLFFSSLMTVNPTIKSYGEIADIVAMQVQILSNTKQYLHQFTSGGFFSSTELTYLTAVYSNLTDLTGRDIEELTGILTDNNWQMTDDQRLSRIDALYKNVLGKYNFLQTFSARAQMQAAQRQQDQNSYQTLGKLF